MVAGAEDALHGEGAAHGVEDAVLLGDAATHQGHRVGAVALAEIALVAALPEEERSGIEILQFSFQSTYSIWTVASSSTTATVTATTATTTTTTKTSAAVETTTAVAVETTRTAAAATTPTTTATATEEKEEENKVRNSFS